MTTFQKNEFHTKDDTSAILSRKDKVNFLLRTTRTRSRSFLMNRKEELKGRRRGDSFVIPQHIRELSQSKAKRHSFHMGDKSVQTKKRSSSFKGRFKNIFKPRKRNLKNLKKKKSKKRLFPIFQVDMTTCNTTLLSDFIFTSFDLLKKRGNVEGIFRTSSNKSVLNDCLEKLNNGVRMVDLEKDIDEIFIVADLIKQFLRDLPCPLWYKIYENLIKDKPLPNENVEKINFQELKIQMHLLLRDHEKIFTYCLLKILHSFVGVSNTKMDSNGMAIIFTPNMYQKNENLLTFISDPNYARAVSFTEILIHNFKKFKFYKKDHIVNVNPKKAFVDSILRVTKWKNKSI